MNLTSDYGLPDATELARILVHTGFRSRDEIIDNIVDYDDEPMTEREATALVDRLWTERAAEARTWPATTDPDRLTSAFEALENNGIVARQDFSCCRNCGLGEIEDEAEGDSRGFVFFHSQDSERVANGEELWLFYGTYADKTDENTVAIGQEVVAALTKAGLPVVWSGSADDRIQVRPVDWKKRLPAE